MCGLRNFENPQPDSSQSGLGVISGWACEAEEIAVEFENGVTGRALHHDGGLWDKPAGYGGRV